jgi:CheY-like chemotaxis protein
VAYDGARALETARACRPDVVVLDLAMPRLDGYSVARRLREQDARLVALTGHGQPHDRRRCEEEGFDFFLLKPADPEALRQVLDRIAPRQAAPEVGEPAAAPGLVGPPHFGTPRGSVHRR